MKWSQQCTLLDGKTGRDWEWLVFYRISSLEIVSEFTKEGKSTNSKIQTNTTNVQSKEHILQDSAMWIQNNVISTRRRIENSVLRFASRFRIWGTAADGQLIPMEPFHLRSSSSSSSSSSLSLLSSLLSPTKYFHLILFCRCGELHNDNGVRLSWIWDHLSCRWCLWPISGLSSLSS